MGGVGGVAPPVAEASLVFKCDNLASPEFSSLKKYLYFQEEEVGEKYRQSTTHKEKEDNMFRKTKNRL